MSNVYINTTRNANGSRNVYFYGKQYDSDLGKSFFRAGVLMPQVDDSRQQPRSLAEKLLRSRW